MGNKTYINVEKLLTFCSGFFFSDVLFQVDGVKLSAEKNKTLGGMSFGEL